MSILKNINYLIKLYNIPCGVPDALVIIETAFKAAPPALLTIFTPGCNEIVKTKLGLSPWHLKGINGFIKKAAPPQAIAANKFLYKIGYFTIEKYLYWYMLADVTTEFFTTWTSFMYQAQQCQLPGAGTAYGNLAPFVTQPGTSGTCTWDIEKGVFGVIPNLGSISILPGFEAAIAYNMTWDSWPVPGQGVSVTTSFEKLGGPGPQDIMSTNDPELNNGNSTLGATHQEEIGNLGVTTYKINYENTGSTFAQIVQSRWNISLTGRKTGNTAFGCNPKPVEWPFPNPFG